MPLFTDSTYSAVPAVAGTQVPLVTGTVIDYANLDHTVSGSRTGSRRRVPALVRERAPGRGIRLAGVHNGL